MLVLSRRLGEHIWIGENIRLTVVSIKGSRVQLGLQAPDDVPILRDELTAKPQAIEPARTHRPRPAVR